MYVDSCFPVNALVNETCEMCYSSQSSFCTLIHCHTYREEEKSYTFKADFQSFVIQARTAAGGKMLLHLLSR